MACHAEQYNHGHIKSAPDYVEFLRLRPSLLAATSSAVIRPSNWVAAAQDIARIHKLGVQDLRKDGGCLWVAIKDTNHPAAAQLKELGFQFSDKRQAFWRSGRGS